MYRFSYKGQSYCEGGFRTWTQADEAQRLKKNEVIAKQLHPEDYAGEMTFRQAGEWWLKNRVPEKRSGRGDKYMLPLAMDYFDKKPLGQIQPNDIDTFLSKINELRSTTRKRGRQEAGDSTRNHYLSLIHALYGRLRKKRMYRGENPADFVEKIQVPTARVRFMYPAEEKILTPAVAKDPDLFPYYRLGVETGMRIGEMMNIRCKHVDLTQRHLFIPEPKNRRSRYVPLGDTLVGFLGSLMAGKAPDDRLLPNWGYLYLRNHFYKIRDAAGIKNLRIHDWRHTYAYNMLSQGISIYKVSKLMGHSSINVTESHYGHLAAKDLRDAMESAKPFLSCNQIATADQVLDDSERKN